MRMFSPFPYKVLLKEPNKRLKWGEVDGDLVQWVMTYTVERSRASNPLIKEYKRNIVNHWCNMVFGSEHWDFEYLEDTEGVIIEYSLCFKNEENCSLLALKWN